MATPTDKSSGASTPTTTDLKVPVPHTLFQSGKPVSDGIRGIELQGWKIERQVKPISDSATIESYEKRFGFPIPEMIFGDNYLSISYPASGFQMQWNPWDALAFVSKDVAADQWLKVAYAEEWTNYSSDSLHHAKAPVKKYDWTYSTTYSGTLKNSPYGEFEPTEDHINYDKLKIPEPILFFDETVLYEDELADNGVSITSVKVRVMPSGFFVLQRFLMRVDGVAFRLFDTRVYHEFGKNYLMRECLARECAYKDIVKLLPKGKGRDSSPDISNLGDPAWVASAIASQPPAPETSKNASPFVQDKAEKLWVF